jgi:hypothetical protein
MSIDDLLTLLVVCLGFIGVLGIIEALDSIFQQDKPEIVVTRQSHCNPTMIDAIERMLSSMRGARTTPTLVLHTGDEKPAILISVDDCGQLVYRTGLTVANTDMLRRIPDPYDPRDALVTTCISQRTFV